LFKSVFMPDFQDDDFTLVGRQFGQTAHRRPLVRAFCWRALEPAFRFQFARQPAPQAPAVIQGVVAKTAHAIVLRLLRRLGPLHEREERSLQNVLSLAMAQTQRPAVQDQIGRFGSVQGFAPPALLVALHESTG